MTKRVLRASTSDKSKISRCGRKSEKGRSTAGRGATEATEATRLGIMERRTQEAEIEEETTVVWAEMADLTIKAKIDTEIGLTIGT